MLKMNKKSITVKLTLIFIIIIVFSTLIIGIVAITIFKNSIYNLKTTNMKNHGNEIVSSFKNSSKLDFNSPELLEKVKVINKIIGEKLLIIDSSNKVFTASSDTEGLININDSQIISTYSSIFEKTLSGESISQEVYSPYYDDYMMTISVPIKNSENIIIGSLILSSSMIDISNLMDKFFFYLIIAVLIEIIITGFLSYYFSLKITKPIKQINNSALEMANGNLGVLSNIYQKDEIGELSNSFDLLSLKLQYSMNKLSQERNKLSYIINSTDEGIFALDKNINIININDAALQTLYLQNENLKISLINVLIQINLLNEVKSVLDTKEVKCVTKKFNDKTLDFSISPIFNDSKEVIGVVVVILDITEKENLEQMRKDFIANVSHEFKTPLTVIKGNLESIVDGIIPEIELIDNIKTLLKETDRLQKMVEDLLDLSKLEAGKVVLELQELDINSIIKDTARTLRPLLNSKKISLNLYLEENTISCLTDYDKFKQLLIIFLDNAIKFSKENDEIQIKTRVINNNIEISIKDDGIGIEKNKLDLLGERFYKVDKSRTYSSKGVGLGLSIAKNLCNLLNGKFDIESELNEGTTIKLTFPLKNTRSDNYDEKR